jgi:hypothetical protein
MKTRRGFSKEVVTAIRNGKILGIRAEPKPHRVIGIWAVVVENRVFVRSWSQRAKGWYRTFLEEPAGVIEVDCREIPVRAVFIRSERLKTAVDRAYAEKYNTPGSLHFVRGFARSRKRRDTSVVITDLQFVSFEAVDSLDGGWGCAALKPRGRTPCILVRNSDQPMLHCILVNVI